MNLLGDRRLRLPCFGMLLLLATLIAPVCAGAQDDKRAPDSEHASNDASIASNWVPLDSWAYAAVDRLAALGYTPSAQFTVRPWSRLQFARALEEANEVREEQVQVLQDVDPEANQLIEALQKEFAYDDGLLHGYANRSFGVEEIYLRATSISGQPLRDSFHFAQTIADDFGRPYGQGWNSIYGTALHGEWGPVALNLRGEFQQAQSLANYRNSALQAISVSDGLPVQTLPGVTALQRFRPIEATIALKLAGWQATFGEQNQWWGQARSSSLLLSNNAEAPVLLSLQRDRPFELPGVGRRLGRINNTFFVGQLRGHHYIRGPYPNFVLTGSSAKAINPQPFIWGETLDLKMTPNLELGFSVVCIFAGYGRPATVGTWLHTFSFSGNHQPLDPGKRYGGFQFSYRLPHLRNWVTLYADGMANDEPTPINYPQDSSWNPGLYFARIPHLPHMDARIEAMYTDVPGYADGVGAYYANTHYAEGYRNASQLMGSWVGRGGVGYHASTTYWLSPRTKFELEARRQLVDRQLLSGGNLTDLAGAAKWKLKGGFELSGKLGYESWRFPVLADSPTRNVTLQLEIRHTGDYAGKF